MTSLVAILSSGKGTWGQVSSLIKAKKWDKVYLVCNDFSYKNFDIEPNVALKLLIDEKNPKKSMDKLSVFLKKDIKDFEVALNIVSGSGFEHMILIGSVLKAGLGMRFVYAQDSEVQELEIFDQKFISEEDEF